jgi:type II secretory ATPase GspE/PulE/Tfp pilus assembly ATPase PilB-like protein
LCSQCKEEVKLSNKDADELGLPHVLSISHPKGCSHCHNTGYRGRVAIGEFLMVDESVRTILKESEGDSEIRSLMKTKGMKFLSDQLIELLQSQTTSLDEIIRVGVKEV